MTPDDFDYELQNLLGLDGATFDWRGAYELSFRVWRVEPTKQRPHGIRYALVLRRQSDGQSLVRYDNAHAVRGTGRGYRISTEAHDHLHKGQGSRAQTYRYTSPSRLLQDFFTDVERIIDAEERKR
jgi:uncharacterized protein DUF6516